MRRLVYSPKVYAFVRTDDTANGTTPYLDISDYIVRGNVTRLVGSASTASLTLRNPNKIFTGNNVGRTPTFHPMDPITIYMSRYEDFPVQVFTGYLDKTPYLQLFPGTVQLQASCTLKRLLHTYWDPALPFTREFMAKYGWFQDPTTGQMQNAASQATTVGDKGKLDDGSIGQVLYAVLTEARLGNWKDNEVFIEQLPSDLIERITDIYKGFAEDQKVLEDQLTALFRQIVGSGSNGTGGGNPNGSANVTPSGTVTGLDKIIPGLVTAAVNHGIPPLFVVTTWNAEGAVSDTTPNFAGARGYFQFTSAVPYSFYTNKPVNYPKDAGDLAIAADLFCGAARYKLDHNPSYKNQANWEAWAEDTQKPGTGAYASYWAAKLAEAKQWITKYASGLPYAPGTVSGTVQTKDSTTSPPKGSSAGSDSSGGVKIYAPIAGNVSYGRGWHEASLGVVGETTTSGHLHWHSGIDAGVPAGTPCIAPCDGEITYATSNWSDGGMIHFKFTKDVGGIKKGTIIGWGHIEPPLVGVGPVKGGTMIARSGNPSGGPHVHFILRTDGTDSGGDGNADPSPLLHALMKGSTAVVDATDSTTAGSTTGTADGSTLSNSTATAFANQVSWSSIEESSEAILLQGDKSLMNDKQIMPFIQELTSAALRQFQSLPNGDFFAFFPDYFGDFNHRKPYWKIDDIEILDGKIELTDDALATHVYIVGDTGVPFDGVNFVDQVLSGGVVTIFNAFESGFVLGGDDETQAASRTMFDPRHPKSKLLAERADAVKFLQKYGARPYYEEVPAIRSPYYEAFYAFQTFQLLWSRTFLTEFQFTFMPEVYPGGIVAFEDHNLQCYVDSVSHDFDYEAGFTTTAQLSAPAYYDPTGKGRDPIGLSRGLVRATPNL